MLWIHIWLIQTQNMQKIKPYWYSIRQKKEWIKEKKEWN